jgi:F-type H+-transporting ATPase subunit O
MEPPITMYGIAGRYANALYASAAKKSQLLDVEADLELFKTTVGTSPVLRNFVIDPSISRSSKAAGIATLMDSAKAAETTKNALVALAEGGRMGEVFKVMDMYKDLLTAAKGEVKAVITSATELPAADLKKIVDQLKEIQAGGTIQVTTLVDPGLINGITIELGDKFIDLSTATQLKKLQALLVDGI